MSNLDTPLVNKLIDLAIEEDLAFGDVTSTLCIPEHHVSRARVIAREDLVMCGGDLVERIFARLGWKVAVSISRPDGEFAGAEEELAILQGSTRHLLGAERIILNFLQRLSGVATRTRKIVEGCPALTVLDTRKTMPGWRILDKYAVATGGGRNHRMNLSEMVLIKNNHIDANNGDINGLFDRLLASKPWYIPIECEVRSVAELKRVLPFQPNFIMLDNMSDDMIAEALSVIKLSSNPPKVEVSGGLTTDRLKSLAMLGVSCVSMGGLTTAAVNVDISLRIVE